MSILSFIFSQTARNIRHSWSVQLMTTFTVTLSVLIFSFFYLIYTNMVEAGSRLGDDLRLIVYLDETPSSERKALYTKNIHNFGKVEKVFFISPDEAFQRLEKQLGTENDVLKDLTSSFLPYSIDIYPSKELRNLSRIKSFSDYLSSMPGVSKVQYGHSWIERFSYFIKLLRLIVILSGTLLLFTTIFMVSYTIRLTVVARHQELKVLRYLGATNWYIKGPVLVEGFLLGFLGSTLGLAALYILFQWIKTNFSGPGFMNLFTLSFLPASHTVLILIISVLLCTSGSMISVRKLLRI
ncbi:MAG: FtsX-like permease family protein [Desulfobulbaceae bacterium]|uniref:Cell division protein FtsX n=1 Tax=Candidatus Desulfobia pelagia TaxID=2841692 RepID=A0A8J6NI98_9BACT|nr:FtsX-like permease family protein [Candidatus Desulfobia pelagia]